MSPKPVAIGCLCVLLMTAAVAQQSEPSAAERSKQRHRTGHSQFGETDVEGRRERPTRIAGIRSTHFPVTTDDPEVQMWFDQGHPLLHSFWSYEAERAFRWASKLEPDNPMPYGGLMRAVGGGARARAFIKEASHSTIRIDKDSRVYGAKHGGAPFDDVKFLTSQLQRMNEKLAASRTATVTAAR